MVFLCSFHPNGIIHHGLAWMFFGLGNQIMEHAMKTPYNISTLKDIFELPTIEQMTDCLNELGRLMVAARDMNDQMVEIVATKGETIEKAIEWPETLEWVDDGKGDIGIKLVAPSGEIVADVDFGKVDA